MAIQIQSSPRLTRFASGFGSFLRQQQNPNSKDIELTAHKFRPFIVLRDKKYQKRSIPYFLGGKFHIIIFHDSWSTRVVSLESFDVCFWIIKTNRLIRRRKFNKKQCEQTKRKWLITKLSQIDWNCGEWACVRACTHLITQKHASNYLYSFHRDS